ncbi:hypothetical protein ASD65_12775 [Microbacterium sp. Root61]|nr:hypothetical protein ASD65_12775 [Microbacterium sp. Root61]
MLIATDLDGTLVANDSATVPPYTAAVLRRMDDAGIPVVFVTARPLRWMDAFWPHVGEHGLAVVSNGAITFDVHRRRIRSLIGIDAPTGLGLTADIADAVPGAWFAIECADGMRLDPAYVEQYPVPADTPRGVLSDIWDQPAVKLLVRAPSTDADDLHGRVVAAVGERATVTWSVSGLVEISALGVTKASALAALCAEVGVAADEVYAFGDMPNDIPMLSWAGTAYAVANAHDSVRAIADHIAPACTEEGVAQVLAELLDQRG